MDLHIMTACIKFISARQKTPTLAPTPGVTFVEKYTSHTRLILQFALSANYRKKID